MLEHQLPIIVAKNGVGTRIYFLTQEQIYFEVLYCIYLIIDVKVFYCNILNNISWPEVTHLNLLCFFQCEILN